MSGVFRTARTPTKSGHNAVFRWTYWSEYTASPSSFRIVNDGGELHRLKVELAYSKRPQKGLWWWATSAMTVSSKGALRHHCTKLLREEFEKTLRKRGYTRDGSRMIQDGQEGLVGSLQMLWMAKITDQKLDHVQDLCARMLDSIQQTKFTPVVRRARSQPWTSKTLRPLHQKRSRQ